MYPTQLPPDPCGSYTESISFTQPRQTVRPFLHDRYEIGMHTHDFYEVNIVLRGEGQHYIGNTSVPVSPGDVYVLPPRCSHGYAGTGLAVYHILLRQEVTERYREALTATPGYTELFSVEPFLRGVYRQSLCLRLSPEETDRLMQTLHRLEEDGRAGRYAGVEVETVALLMGLCRRMRAHTVPDGADSGILRAMTYIREHLDESLTVERLLPLAAMSRSTFVRQFRRVTGMAPMAYCRQCRVAAARELLATGNYSKAAVAQMCGFYDSSHMQKLLFS